MVAATWFTIVSSIRNGCCALASSNTPLMHSAPLLVAWPNELTPCVSKSANTFQLHAVVAVDVNGEVEVAVDEGVEIEVEVDVGVGKHVDGEGEGSNQMGRAGIRSEVS